MAIATNLTWILDEWRLVLSAIVVLTFLAELGLAVRKSKLGAKGWQSYLLRAIAVFSLALLILEPGWQKPLDDQVPPRIAVLVDQSASMSIRDYDKKPPGQPRYQELQERWRNQGPSTEFVRYNFGGHAGLAPGAELYPEPPQQAHSNLDQALHALAKAKDVPLSGVLVLSDGLVATRGNALASLRDAISALSLPVSFANVSKQNRKDLALVQPKIPEFCFAQNVQEFSVDLTRTSIEQHTFKAELWRDNERIDQQTLTLAPRQNKKTITFRHRPDRTGNFVYSIRVEPVAQEATKRNNAVYRQVSVLRDKVRVLHVAGRPDWDVRALRSLLKRNPNVELLSYYILRDEQDQMRDDPKAPMSLIQFPRQELFEEELGSFDLIILQNFDATARANYNRNLGQFILDGGTIVVIGGDLGLATGDYSVPPFSKLLPALPKIEDMRTTPYRLEMTKKGKLHPVTAWMHALSGPQGLDLPPIDTFNRSSISFGQDDKSQVLLQTTPTADEPSYPLLAVAEPGKGRVLELLTASSWRWGFAAKLSRLQGLRPYDRLWQEMIRWSLREDPSPLTLKSSDRLVRPGQPIRYQISTHQRDGAPQPQVPVTLELKQGATIIVRQTLTSDGEGQIPWTWTPKDPGTYELVATRPSPTPNQGPIAKSLFSYVGLSSQDLDPLNPDPFEPRLKHLIEQSGGRYWRNQDIPQDLISSTNRVKTLPKTRRISSKTEQVALWNHPLAGIALFAFIAEWWLRRRRGQDGAGDPSPLPPA